MIRDSSAEEKIQQHSVLLRSHVRAVMEHLLYVVGFTTQNQTGFTDLGHGPEMIMRQLKTLRLQHGNRSREMFFHNGFGVRQGSDDVGGGEWSLRSDVKNVAL